MCFPGICLSPVPSSPLLEPRNINVDLQTFLPCQEKMHWKVVLINTWEMIRFWEVWKETFLQKLYTYHLPPTSSFLLYKDLSGLSVIVTGCTSGIGLHIAKELAMAGAHVIMACRNTKAADEIASSWREEVYNRRIINVEVLELDLLSFSSVKSFADSWERRGKPLHLLINNAGILKMEDAQRFSSEGIEQHMHVNHVAPALLTLLLLPSLLKASLARIINVNSAVHFSGVVEPQCWNSKTKEGIFNSMKAYGSSKLAHIMFLKVLARKLCEQGNPIQCIAVHPGSVATNVAGPSSKKVFFMYDGAEGARSAIFCATSDTVKDNLVKGFAYYSCTCKPGNMSAQAEDMNACLKVWEKTLEILNMEEDYVSQVREGLPR